MSSGRKRATDRHYSAEDQALNQISKEAEERIQARRQARAEAREMRLKEIERQQKEEEERQKAQAQGYDSVKSVSSYSGSRRGSNDSTESDRSHDSNDPKDQVRKFKNQLRDLEEKYKASMLNNAKLDNVKTSNVFQIELLKEQLEEQEEAMIEIQREYKDKCREFDFLKRDFAAMKLENEGLRQQMDIKDRLIKDSGLVIVASDEGELSLTKCSDMTDVPVSEMGTSIISEEAANLLKSAGEGTLGNKSENPDDIQPVSNDGKAPKAVVKHLDQDAFGESENASSDKDKAIDKDLIVDESEGKTVDTVIDKTANENAIAKPVDQNANKVPLEGNDGDAEASCAASSIGLDNRDSGMANVEPETDPRRMDSSLNDIESAEKVIEEPVCGRKESPKMDENEMSGSEVDKSESIEQGSEISASNLDESIDDDDDDEIFHEAVSEPSELGDQSEQEVVGGSLADNKQENESESDDGTDVDAIMKTVEVDAVGDSNGRSSDGEVAEIVGDKMGEKDKEVDERSMENIVETVKTETSESELKEMSEGELMVDEGRKNDAVESEENEEKIVKLSKETVEKVIEKAVEIVSKDADMNSVEDIGNGIDGGVVPTGVTVELHDVDKDTVTDVSESVPSTQQADTDKVPSTLQADTDKVQSTLQADTDKVPSTLQADTDKVASTLQADTDKVPSTLQADTDKVPSTLQADTDKVQSPLQADNTEETNVRHSLGSDLAAMRERELSFISMESDVTYHSESEALDSGFDMENTRIVGWVEENDGTPENVKVDFTVHVDTKFDNGQATVGNESVKEEINAKDASNIDSGSKNEKDSEVVAAAGGVDSAVTTVGDSATTTEIIVGSDKENDSEENDSDSENNDEELDFSVLDEYLDETTCNGEDGGNTEMNLQTNTTHGSDGEKLVDEKEVAAAPGKNRLSKQEKVEDEVFMSVVETPVQIERATSLMMDKEEALQRFVHNYVKDVVMDSVTRFNEEVKNEQVCIRKNSLTSDGVIEIKMTRRQSAEKLVQKATPYFTRSMSAGHIQVLSTGKIPPKRSSETGVNFLSYQVESEADIVLTSIDEEKNPAEILNGSCLMPKVSGFGVCYSTAAPNSALNSDINSDDDEDLASLEQNLQASFDNGTESLVPEFTVMKVSIDKDDAGEEMTGDAQEDHSENVQGKADSNSDDKGDKDNDSEKETISANKEDGSPTQPNMPAGTKSEQENVDEATANLEIGDSDKAACTTGEKGKTPEAFAEVVKSLKANEEVSEQAKVMSDELYNELAHDVSNTQTDERGEMGDDHEGAVSEGEGMGSEEGDRARFSDLLAEVRSGGGEEEVVRRKKVKGKEEKHVRISDDLPHVRDSAEGSVASSEGSQGGQGGIEVGQGGAEGASGNGKRKSKRKGSKKGQKEECSVS